MSWLEKIQDNLTITTGEGSEFVPKYIQASKSKEYNTAAFSFIGIPGQLIDRRQPSARQFPMQFYFDGDNNIDEATRFEIACNDPRPWTISHPYYGDLIVQPTNVSFNNNEHNVTTVNATVIETITEDFPAADVDVEDQINADAEAANEQLAEQFDEADAQSIGTLSDNNAQAYESGALNAPQKAQNAYFNAFNEANSAIDVSANKPIQAMQTAQKVLAQPRLFGENVKQRVKTLKNQFARIKSTIRNTFTLSQKNATQASLGATLTAAAQSTTGNYDNRSEALSVIDDLQELSESYIGALDTMRGDGFLPNADAVNASVYTAAFAAANVLTILNDTRQERSVELEADSNIIVLAHRFNQIDTIDDFLKLNDIGITEHLQIKQGREIKYYV